MENTFALPRRVDNSIFGLKWEGGAAAKEQQRNMLATKGARDTIKENTWHEYSNKLHVKQNYSPFDAFLCS